ncbi:hypothetical protein GOP47_0009763 [Adiantum capillus-veneris]|uniref:Protein kinase domain-containing protein n=1 Tax=Adiantum capillus-veneris TaxID=13818 RepID=A0A9D4UYD7_ADICA|nr:hypothetical protein GOP47_0009763 [Adiantum capillus-veneris]
MARGALYLQSSGAASPSIAAGQASGSNSNSHCDKDRDPQAADQGGTEAEELLYLAHQGCVAQIESLLSQGLVSVNYPDYERRTALHIAACEGHLDVVRLLISKGADVNASDNWNSTRKSSLQVQISLPVSEYEVNPAELQYLDKTFTKRGYQVAAWRGIQVFVKCFKDLSYGEKAILAFRWELSLIQTLRHPNIVQFLGAVTQSTPLMIIFEYLPQGDLYQYLNQNRALKPSKVIDFSLNIARGLNFMHEHKPEAIVHRDLKPKNILRDNSGHLKVADLGLSKMLKFAAQVVSEDGPPPLKGSSCRYMAPEVFKHNAIGKEVDVFAFGLIVQEMVEGVAPMEEMDNEKVPSAYADKKRPPFKASLRRYPGDLKELIKQCWDDDPKSRPTFAHIIDRLESIKAKQRSCIWRITSLWTH